ncbi:MAG: AAA-associated domain-containing protein [Candidatus Micrarchaeota archaeon]|nr:AAA-associated domain-containing protein [Candidatus Micrarchaeota archaeon]
MWVPDANITEVVGLADVLHKYDNRMRIDELQRYLGMEIDELIPVIDAAKILGIIIITRNDIMLNNKGQLLIEMSLDERKKLISSKICRMPIFKKIALILKKEPKPKAFFIKMIEKELFEKEAESQFKRIIQWGRYADLLLYDSVKDEIRLSKSCLVSGPEKDLKEDV